MSAAVDVVGGIEPQFNTDLNEDSPASADRAAENWSTISPAATDAVAVKSRTAIPSNVLRNVNRKKESERRLGAKMQQLKDSSGPQQQMPHATRSPPSLSLKQRQDHIKEVAVEEQELQEEYPDDFDIDPNIVEDIAQQNVRSDMRLSLVHTTEQIAADLNDRIGTLYGDRADHADIDGAAVGNVVGDITSATSIVKKSILDDEEDGRRRQEQKHLEYVRESEGKRRKEKDDAHEQERALIAEEKKEQAKRRKHLLCVRKRADERRWQAEQGKAQKERMLAPVIDGAESHQHHSVHEREERDLASISPRSARFYRPSFSNRSLTPAERPPRWPRATCRPASSWACTAPQGSNHRRRPPQTTDLRLHRHV